MFKFACDDGHARAEWVYEAAFSLCPECKRQRGGRPLPLGEWNSFKPAPMQRLVLPCAWLAMQTPVVENLPHRVEPNRIVSVEFMDGHDNEGGGPLEQFINLAVEEKWVDGGRIRNVDRLGARPRVKVRFARPGAEKFELELLRDSSLLAYTSEEEKHEHYRQHPASGEPLAETTGSDGTVVLQGKIALAAAGGYVYRLCARDTHGNQVVSGSSLCVWRRIFIQSVVMKSAASSFEEWWKAGVEELKAQFASMYFDIIVREPRWIADLDNIACREERQLFYQSIEEQCVKEDVSRFRPRLVILAFIRHFAEENAGVQQLPIEAHDPKAPFSTGFAFDAHVVGHGTYAWVGLGTRGWLASLPTLFEVDGKTKVLGLPSKCVQVEAPNVLFRKRLSRVVLDSTALDEPQRQALAKGGVLKFKFRYPQFRGGISIVGTSNLIAVATQMTWQDTPLANLCGFIIHELGHKLGMVPSGPVTGLCDLSATPTSYEGKGHTGPHCHFGLDQMSSYLNVGGAKCVMFGAPTSTTAFCEACTVALRKVHVRTEWTPCWEL